MLHVCEGRWPGLPQHQWAQLLRALKGRGCAVVMSSDIRLHTNQISQFCIEAARLEDRLRRAEMEIVRNEKSRISDRRSREDEINGS